MKALQSAGIRAAQGALVTPTPKVIWTKEIHSTYLIWYASVQIEDGTCRKTGAFVICSRQPGSLYGICVPLEFPVGSDRAFERGGIPSLEQAQSMVQANLPAAVFDPGFKR